MKLGSLFTGYGGLDAAACEFYGARTVWTSDIDPGACKIIAHRYPDVPNLGDITAIDWSQVEPVDILTGGFPCQDISHAGKRAGMHDGTRSGLWSHMAEAIRQLRPRYVVAENVRGLLSAEATSDVEPCPWCVGGATDGEPFLRALGCVLGDLAELGYDAQWCGLRAADVGAPHGRFRVFIVASDASDRPRTPLASRQVSQSCWRAASDAERLGDAGWGGVRDMGSEAEDRSREAREQRDRDAADDRGAVAAADTSWGDYGPAIRRWERVLGRPAPAPTETSSRGSRRLSPRFVEWMLGLSPGWVTDVPDLSRNAQLKALGNGVVPQQALEALRRMEALEIAA